MSKNNSIFSRFCQFVKENPVKGAFAIAAIVIGVAAVVVGTVVTCGAMAPVVGGGLAAVFGAVGGAGVAGGFAILGGAGAVSGTLMAVEYTRKKQIYKQEQERIQNALNKGAPVSTAVATTGVHNSESDMAKTLAGNTHSPQMVLQQGAKPANKSIWGKAGKWVAKRKNQVTSKVKKVELQPIIQKEDSDGEGFVAKPQ